MTQLKHGRLVRIHSNGMIGGVESIGPDKRVRVRIPLVKAICTVDCQDLTPLNQQETDIYCRDVEQVCQDAQLYFEELGRAGWEVWETQKKSSSQGN